MKNLFSNPINTERILFLFSLWAIIFFGFLFLNQKVFEWDNLFLGVVQELFTLPMILATFAACIASTIFTFKQRFSLRNFTLYSMLITLSVSTFIIGSFM